MNAEGAMRLAEIAIDVAVDVDDEHVSRLEHCARIVKHCLITASLLEGIAVTHAVRKA